QGAGARIAGAPATRPAVRRPHRGRRSTLPGHAGKAGVEGVISKRVDRPYMPGDRKLWVQSQCLNREEFVVVGWTDPGGVDRISAPCCSATTPRIVDCSMRDGRE